MRIRNTTTGEIIATNVKTATGWFEPIIGLIMRKRIDHSEGMWLEDCRVIHTVGMQTRIDVVFLDADSRVMRMLCSVAQNRLAIGCYGARSVLQLGSGTLSSCDVLIGDRLELEPE